MESLSRLREKMEFPVDKGYKPIYMMQPVWPYPAAIAAIRKKRQGGHRQQRRVPAKQVFGRSFA
jgi:hypothetical protein